MLNKKLNYIFYLEVLILIGLIYSLAVTPLLLLSYELIKDNIEFKIFIPLIYIDDILLTIWLSYRVFIKIENRYNLLGWFLDKDNVRKYDLAIEYSNDIGLLLYLYSYILIFIPYIYILLVDFQNKEQLFNDTIFQMYIYYKIGFYSLYNLSVALCILFVILVLLYRCCCYKCLKNSYLMKSNKIHNITYIRNTEKTKRMFSV